MDPFLKARYSSVYTELVLIPIINSIEPFLQNDSAEKSDAFLKICLENGTIKEEKEEIIELIEDAGGSCEFIPTDNLAVIFRLI